MKHFTVPFFWGSFEKLPTRVANSEKSFSGMLQLQKRKALFCNGQYKLAAKLISCST